VLKTPADGARRLTPSPYWVSTMDPIVPRNPRISRGPLPIPDRSIIMDRLWTENSGTALFLVQPVESEFPDEATGDRAQWLVSRIPMISSPK
jgi:hypothetical protein